MQGSNFLDVLGPLGEAVRAVQAVAAAAPGEAVRFRYRNRALAVIDADELENLREHLHVLTPIENTRAFLEAAGEDERGEVHPIEPDMLDVLRLQTEHGHTRAVANALDRYVGDIGQPPLEDGLDDVFGEAAQATPPDQTDEPAQGAEGPRRAAG